GEIFGMVHLSDISWATPGETAIQNYNKGDNIKVKVLTIDIEKERIGLGIKQLDDDPFQLAHSKRGQAVTCTVTALHDHGIDVAVLDGLSGFVRRSDLARDRNEQRPDRFAVGDKFDAKLMQIDRGGRRITLSIKALEVEEEKQAVEEYGSTDSGASLGDILGAAISRKQEEAASASQSPDEGTTVGAEDGADSEAAESDAAAAPEPDAEGEAEAEAADGSEEDGKES
ncbi:MAG: S1 RNA-binding domain-containing protein, partial [Alphaproteobacteria bacterium]